MIHTIFDVEFFKRCVIDWINADGEFFVRDIFNESSKRRRFNRAKKMNYWETPWGEMLRNPHIRYANSRVAR